jgi:uncharacterized protein YcgL (UPF0745 family)
MSTQSNQSESKNLVQEYIRQQGFGLQQPKSQPPETQPIDEDSVNKYIRQSGFGLHIKS